MVFLSRYAINHYIFTPFSNSQFKLWMWIRQLLWFTIFMRWNIQAQILKSPGPSKSLSAFPEPRAEGGQQRVTDMKLASKYHLHMDWCTFKLCFPFSTSIYLLFKNIDLCLIFALFFIMPYCLLNLILSCILKQFSFVLKKLNLNV